MTGLDAVTFPGTMAVLSCLGIAALGIVWLYAAVEDTPEEAWDRQTHCARLDGRIRCFNYSGSETVEVHHEAERRGLH